MYAHARKFSLSLLPHMHRLDKCWVYGEPVDATEQYPLYIQQEYDLGGLMQVFNNSYINLHARHQDNIYLFISYLCLMNAQSTIIEVLEVNTMH